MINEGLRVVAAAQGLSKHGFCPRQDDVPISDTKLGEVTMKGLGKHFIVTPATAREMEAALDRIGWSRVTGGTPGQPSDRTSAVSWGGDSDMTTAELKLFSGRALAVLMGVRAETAISYRLCSVRGMHFRKAAADGGKEYSASGVAMGESPQGWKKIGKVADIVAILVRTTLPYFFRTCRNLA